VGMRDNQPSLPPSLPASIIPLPVIDDADRVAGVSAVAVHKSFVSGLGMIPRSAASNRSLPLLSPYDFIPHTNNDFRLANALPTAQPFLEDVAYHLSLTRSAHVLCECIS
jgi:hypothetical protein